MKKLVVLIFMLGILLTTSVISAIEDEELPEFDFSNATSFVDESTDIGIYSLAAKPVTIKNIRIAWYVYKNSNANSYRSYTDSALISYNGAIAYCLEPLILLKTAASYTDGSFETNSTLTTKQKEDVKLIIKYGYSYANHKTDKYYLAAQKLIWEALGYHVNYYSDTNFSKGYSVKTEETEIKRLISLDKVYPSFSDEKHVIEVGQSLNIIDDNGVLKDFEITAVPEGMTVTKKDNTLTISAIEKTAGKIIFTQGVPKNETTTLGFAKSSSSQNLVVSPTGSVDSKLTEISVTSLTYGDAVITKQDEWTNERLAGVSFNISTDKNMSDSTSYTTNKNGEIVLAHLETGTYYYQETSTLDGYIIDPTIKSFEVAENQKTVVLVKNQPITSNVTLNKTVEIDSIAASENKEGFIFNFKRLDKQQEIITITTDKNGLASTRLPYGTYQVSEIHVLSYEIKQPWNITINEKETVLNVHNNKSRRDVRIFKIDAKTKQPIVLSNASFEISYNDEKMINPVTGETLFTTDESGSFVLEQLLSGTYYLTEISAPKGYHLATKQIPIVVEDGNDLFEVFIENQPQLGEINIKKTGQKIIEYKVAETDYGDMYSPAFNYAPLSNARYELRAKTDIIGMDNTLHYQKGQVVADEITDKNGNLTISNLPIGDYELEETIAPYGYQLDSTIHNIAITANNTNSVISKQIELKNDLKLKTVTFNKNFEKSLFISEEKSIEQTVFGLYNKKPINQNGIELVPANQLMDIVTLGENGDFTVSLLVENEYYLKELATHPSYNKIANTDLTYHGGIISSNSLKLTNNLKRLSFQINKSSLKKKHPLQGAVFGIYASNETDKLLQDKTSDEKGVVIFDNLELGEYIIKELVAPEGYQLINNPIKITVMDDVNLNQIAVVNDTLPKTGISISNSYWGMLAIIPVVVIAYLKHKSR